MIHISPMALCIGAVFSNLAARHGAFVVMHTECSQAIHDELACTRDFALTVRIFNTQEKDAAVQMRDALSNKPGIQVADMHKTSRTWRNAGNFGPFWQLAWRVP